MPVRGLHDYLETRGLYRQSPIQELRGTRIGVDAINWLRSFPIREPFQVAIGGMPTTLIPAVQNELEFFMREQVTPVFVFPGMPLSRKEKPAIHPDPRVDKREQAWAAYHRGNKDEASFLFFETEKFLAANFQQNVMRFLYERGAEYFRAPYGQYAQLAHFLHPSPARPGLPPPPALVHAVFGSLDMLMYGVTKLITSIDVVAGTFRWVDFGSILMDMKLNPDQFVDVCIFAGLDFSSTIPALNPVHGSGQRFSFRSAIDLIEQHGSGVAAVRALTPTTPILEKLNYIDQFLRAKATIGHHIILDSMTGHCEPRNRDFAPADLHEIVGPRLPDDVFFLMSQGAISTVVPHTLVTGALIDGHPLVDSDELHDVLVDLQPLRTKTLGLLSFSLGDFFRRKPVVTLRYFDTDPQEIPLNHFEEHGEIAGLRCMISDEEIRAEMQRQNKRTTSEVTINFLLKMQQDLGGSNARVDPEFDIPNGRASMMAAIHLQAMEIRGFLSASREPTMWGSALGMIEGPFDEEAWIVLELLRSKMLHGRALIPVTGSATPNEQEVALLSRVFSLLPLKTAARAWPGPIDHDLMAFNSIVRNMYKSLRNLEEMLLTNLYLTHRLACSPEEILYASFKLPFAQETNTLLGVVLKAFFDPEQDFASVLENCADARIALNRGISFWEQVMRMVNALNADGAIDSDTYELFCSADLVLEPSKAALTSVI